ncbi:carboxymuconolactone decarboxylase family protein [Streptomyces kaniharaensis]|uniref:Carboxymuconolactone decarboxylase family protein n=1 Tax=Streptomyces kaniharaensis TaxID=212423 RepID=A0A6N7KHC2_9ACTN|nr:carboxymuconolactone decarboxylase family protein [Streptomyces kaniharaensis]MQS10766.1 carboxymuconolactone decarboxylase family protein [Streptomyces kaniharaensis]
MAGPLLRTALRGSLARIRHVAPVRPGRAGAEVAGVYAEVEREFGMLAPPVALHAPAPPVLAATWVMLRETLVAAGRVDRAAKESVAAAVSRANTCPYCVEVHTTAVGALGPAVAPADRSRLAAWAAGEGAAPFPAEHAPELVGVAVTFHYLNRMVSVFLEDSPLPPGAPPPARRAARALLGRFVRQSALAAPSPGASLDLLPGSRLPADLSWAAGTPSVAGAFARAAVAMETAGERSVPEPVRNLVVAELADWDGRPPGLGRGWGETAVATLPADSRPAGRLALLTAKAAYQVDDGVVADFRRTAPGDRALVELTAWASLTAARRLGTRLAGET